MTAHAKVTSREAQRLRTRERILRAAFDAMRQSGLAGADVSTIASAAGVGYGTFYVHFPTKEHVLVELERREEARMASLLAQYLTDSHPLADTLAETVRLVEDLKSRVGPVLFAELLSAHFSPTRPSPDSWTDHPMIVLLVGELERVGATGALHPEVDAFYSAGFFLLGVYGALAESDTADDGRLCKLIASTVRGLEIR